MNDQEELKHLKPSAPKYRLTEAAYIDDRYLDPAAQPVDPQTGDPRPLFINFAGVPGHHMEPADDAAKAMKKKHNQEYIDPILAMTVVN